jgi:hypothetical protein
VNQKTRAVIRNLIDAVNRGQYGMRTAEQAAIAAVDAAEKLLNPPVRFLWTSPGATSLGRYYRADVGGFIYHIERNGDTRDTLGWSSWVGPSGGPEPGGPEQYMGVVHPTLAAAKQACVDYGVAHRRPTT